MSFERRLTRTHVSMLVACSLALGLLAWWGSSPAQAGVEYYCLGAGSGALLAPDGQSGNACYGPRHSLTSNRVFNNGTNNVVGAAALYDCLAGLCQYASWVYGGGYTCHPYSGNNVLYPWEKNGSPYWQYVYGIQYYGVDRWC